MKCMGRILSEKSDSYLFFIQRRPFIILQYYTIIRKNAEVVFKLSVYQFPASIQMNLKIGRYHDFISASSENVIPDYF